MSKRIVLAQLDVPLIVAPMAGGPSTPELAAATTNGGGIGYIAGGSLPAGRLAEQIVAARALTSGPLGVDLLVPQPTTGSPGRFAAYAKALAGEAEHYGVGLGEPHHSDDDWAAKLNLMHDLRPAVVSFTFGLPTIDESRRLKSADIVPVATVTTVEETQLALACGARALVAQGPYAGGHRGTFDPVALVRPRKIDSASHRLNLREGKTE